MEDYEDIQSDSPNAQEPDAQTADGEPAPSFAQRAWRYLRKEMLSLLTRSAIKGTIKIGFLLATLLAIPSIVPALTPYDEVSIREFLSSSDVEAEQTVTQPRPVGTHPSPPRSSALAGRSKRSGSGHPAGVPPIPADVDPQAYVRTTLLDSLAEEELPLVLVGSGQRVLARKVARDLRKHGREAHGDILRPALFADSLHRTLAAGRGLGRLGLAGRAGHLVLFDLTAEEPVRVEDSLYRADATLDVAVVPMAVEEGTPRQKTLRVRGTGPNAAAARLGVEPNAAEQLLATLRDGLLPKPGPQARAAVRPPDARR